MFWRLIHTGNMLIWFVQFNGARWFHCVYKAAYLPVSCWEAVRLLLFCLSHAKMWWISLTTYPFAHESEFLQGFPSGTNGKEPACQWRRHRCRFNPWVGKIPWRKAWQPTPVFLPGGSHGQRSLAGYSTQSHEESDTTEVIWHTRMHEFL